MFLSNKVKSIAAVSLLGLGVLGSQTILTPEARAENRAPVICNPGTMCTVRVSLNNWVTADAVIVPNRSGIAIPRSIVRTWAINGATKGDVSQDLPIKSITIGSKTYSVDYPAKVVSYGNRVMIGANSLERMGARLDRRTNQIILP